jgi:hypothetical protein
MKIETIDQTETELVKSAPENGAGASTAPLETINGKPALRLPGDGRAIGEFAEEIGGMLQEQAIFARQGCAFALNFAGEKLEPALPSWLRTWAEQSVVPYVLKKCRDGEVMKLVRTMSDDTARTVLVSPQFLGRLRRVEFFNPCRLPVMRGNGRIELLPPGYDREALTYTHEAAPEVMPMETEKAKAVIAELLEEFAFADDGGRSHAVAIAAMLTVFASRLLPKGALRPCFIYMGNAEGCGKTLLARLACVPYAAADVRGAPATEEELEKVLLSAVIGGRKVLLLDNLKGHLNSAKLEGFLTAPRYTGRILGLSKEFSGDVDTTVLLTGNRLTITADLRRRTLFVELFMRELRAENRHFNRILDDAAVNEKRPQVLSALWQLIRAWDDAKRPKASRENTSFPRWCETIAGIVEHAGYGCPTAPAEIEGAGDTDTADIAKLGEALELRRRYEFSEIVKLAEAAGLFERFTTDTDHEGNLSRRAKSAFARLLVGYHGRHVTPQKRFVVDGRGHQRRFFAR